MRIDPDMVTLVFYGVTSDKRDIYVWSDGSVTGDVRFIKAVVPGVKYGKEADDKSL